MHGIFLIQALAEEQCALWSAATGIAVSTDPLVRFVGPQLLWGLGLGAPSRIRSRVESLAVDDRRKRAEAGDIVAVREMAAHHEHLRLVRVRAA